MGVPFPLRFNSERNGLHAPNTSRQNREGATGTSSQDHSDAIPINFRDQTNINYRDHSQSLAAKQAPSGALSGLPSRRSRTGSEAPEHLRRTRSIQTWLVPVWH